MNLTYLIYESHEIADQVENMLKERFGVFDIDIHIEPALSLKMKYWTMFTESYLWENNWLSREAN